jgi:AhpD family alkylhydroperoxidase
MSRLPLLTREDLATQDQQVFDRVETARGSPVGNIWRVLLNSPNLTDRVLSLADELRQGTTIERRDRELAVLTVGLVTNCTYEFEHHSHAAVRAGITPQEIKALSDFERSELFSEKDRAIIRFAYEATKNVRVDDHTWNALAKYFSQRHLMEIVLTVAWYNTVVRILSPLAVEFEPEFRPITA